MREQVAEVVSVGVLEDKPAACVSDGAGVYFDHVKKTDDRGTKGVVYFPVRVNLFLKGILDNHGGTCWVGVLMDDGAVG